MSKPATIRSSVDLPEPLGPRTTHSSPSLHGQRQALQRRDAAFRGRIDAEEVAQLDERAHSSASARPGAGAENARRVASRTSAAAARTYSGRGAEHDEHVHLEHERRLGRGRPRSQADEIGDDGGERDAGERAGDEPRRGDGERAQPDDPAQQRGRRALRLEIEQLAPLVAQVAEHGQQDPGQREPERHGRGHGEREQGPVRDRVAAGVGLERVARLDREHVERLRGECAIDLSRARRGREAAARPRSRGPRPDAARFTAAASASPSPTTAWPSTPGKRRIGRDDANGEPLAGDLQRQQAAFVRGGGETRRGEHRHRLAVRRLPRPDPRRDRIRERVVDRPALDPRPADADPALERARYVGSSTATDPSAPGPRPRRVPAAACRGSITIPASLPPRAGRESASPSADTEEAAPAALDLSEDVHVAAASARRTGEPCGEPRPRAAAAPRSARQLRARAVRVGSRQPFSRASVAGRETEQRDPALALEPADASGQPQHRRDLDAGQLAEPLEGRSVLHRDQPPQVLADDVVERHAMRRLVALAARERRAVALGEERQAEADDEERSRDHGVAGVARERERRRAGARASAAGEPLDERAAPAAAARATSTAAANVTSAGSSSVRSPSPSPRASSSATSATAAIAAASSEPEPGAREPAPRRRRRGRRSRPAATSSASPSPSAERTLRASTSPTGAPARSATTAPPSSADREPDRRPGQRERARLGHGHERELPAARAVPGEPPAGCREVGAQRHRRQEREREQERRRLAADDPEPAARRAARRLRLAQLLDRRDAGRS